MALSVWQLSSLALALLIVAGLNAPLAALGCSLLALNGMLILRPDLAYLGTGWSVLLYSVLAVIQIGVDLYFVPIRTRDRQYLAPRRTVNAYLHARLQSLLRPLVAALVLAALPTPFPVQSVAVVGFVCGTAIYWFSAWVREYVAIRRGTLMLTLLELAKHVMLLAAVLMLLWLPVVALVWLVCALLPAALWTARLQQEEQFVVYGGAHASDDA